MSTVHHESVITVRYRLLDASGEVLEGTEGDEVEVLELAEGDLPDEVVAALVGRGAGDSVRVETKDAFGPADPEAIVSIPRDSFADAGDIEELQPGDVVPILIEPEEGDEGDEPEEVEVRVREVNTDGVVVDLNHPYAGLELVFEIELVEVQD